MATERSEKVLEFAGGRPSQHDALKSDPETTSTYHGYIPKDQTLPFHSESRGELIPGLTYLPDFLSQAEHDLILNEITSGDWDGDNQGRRTKQFGMGFHWRGPKDSTLYRIDEPGRDVCPPTVCVGPLERLSALGLGPAPSSFRQLIVNEYCGGQGIKPHIDRRHCFGEYVVGISLLCPSVMDFRHPVTGEVRAILLEPRSVLVLSGEARHEWQHAIGFDSSHVYRGNTILRERRISLTFRQIKDTGPGAAGTEDAASTSE
mmetsp:Transcript_10384/g.23697  ORF Transcript_10384/g.23697 Transcript_10384/m.23697 type:complete len:261 (+) Transcript_10384:54-836(+)